MKASARQISQWAVIFSLTGGLAFPAQSQTQSITPAADGTGTVVNPNGHRYDITGGSLSRDGANLFHSFQRFGLSEGQIANFLSNPAIRNILGRVVGGDASIINGLIQVTGGNSNLFLINPAGIVFGPNASLNVPAAFTATTATGIGFNSGWFNAIGSNDYASLVGTPSAFTFSVAQPGSIVNAGNLILQPGNNLTLLGGTVINTGTLASPGGNISIAAVPGSSNVRISQEGHLLSLEIGHGQKDAGYGGAIAPLSLPQLLAGGTDFSHATGVSVSENGKVMLTGSGVEIPTEGGIAIASGTISAASENAIGGNVNILGNKVGLLGANIDASGSNGGGTILIGGDYQGKGTVPNALFTFVSSDSIINADAVNNGSGGRVILWADKTTQFYGNISTRGGTNGGNGGFVEVSGKENLIFRGNVDLSAPNGTVGTLLLDPENIIIVDGVGTDDAELADGQILFTDSPGATFTISKAALEAIAGDVTLEAANDIAIDTGVSLTFPALGGAIAFTADADNSGVGSFSMDATQTITAEGRNLTITAAAITVGNINTSSTSAAGGSINLTANNGIVSAGNLSSYSQANDGGNVALVATGDIITTSIDSHSGGTGNAGYIALTSSAGGINTTAGALNSSSVDGAGGAIALNAALNIETSDLKATAGDIISTLNQWGGEDFSPNGGNGLAGNITLQSNSGTINTTAGKVLSYSLNSNGGAVNLFAAGNISTGEVASSSSYQPPNAWYPIGNGFGVGGNIAIASTNGDIAVDRVISSSNYGIGGDIAINSTNGAVSAISGMLNASSPSGVGGNVAVTASGNINTIDISSYGYAGGRNIDLNSINGAVTSGTLNAGSSEGDSGNVTVTAYGDISTGDVYSYPYVSGAGGDIAINSTTGAVNSGMVSSFSQSADAGNVTFSAVGDINLTYVSASGSTLGGNIEISSTNGAVNIGAGGLSSSSFSSDGGNVTIAAYGNINTGSIDSSGYNSGGDIAINSSSTTINTAEDTLNASSSSGTGGNISITTPGLLSTGNVNTSGALQGGNVNLTSTYSNVDTSGGTIDVSSTSGTAGNIAIAAYAGSISLGSITGSKNIDVADGGSDDPLSTDADASITSDADNINNLSGSVSLQAHNDITVSEPIFTSSISSLQFRAGRSININADIDTSGGNSNITLRANDNGADISRREPGAGNITMAPDTSLNSGSGNISLELGTLAEVGNITLANLNTTGTVSVNATGGNILRASDTSLITAGSGMFQTTGTGSLGVAAQPLRINLNNLEASSGSGGAFFDSPDRGVTVGGATSFLTGISTFGGGDLTLTAGGDIVVVEDINTSSLSNAGDIALNSQTGSIDTTAVRLSSYSSQGNAGAVTLTASGDINTGNVQTYGVLQNGGNIALNSSNGAVNTTAGELSSRSDSGQSGQINLAASGDISTGIVNSFSSYGVGGDIAINSSNGAVNTTAGGIDASSISGSGGNVAIAAPGDISINNIVSQGDAGGGDIALNSSNGSVTSFNSFFGENALNSYSAAGAAGNVTVNAIGNVNLQGISSYGGTQGGNINLNSGGAINITSNIFFGEDTNSLRTYSSSGTAGSITLNATGSISAQGINSYGQIQGGNISVTSNDAINIAPSGFGEMESLKTYSPVGTAGNIDLSGSSSVTVNGIRSEGYTQGGNINLTSSGGAINAAVGNVDSYSVAGTGGDVTLDAFGDISANNIATYGDLQSGNVVIRSNNGAITTSAVTTIAPNGTSGNIQLNTFSTAGNITTANVTSSGSEGAGNITIDSAGNVITENVSSESSDGESGDTTVEADGDATTGDVDSSGNTGSGDTTVTAGGDATTGDVSSTSNEGSSGDATVTAGNDANTGNVSSSGNTGAGNGAVTAGNDANTGNVSSSSSQGSSGNATVTADGNATTGNVSSSGNTGAGNGAVTAGNNANTGNVSSSSSQGSSGNATVTADGDVAAGNVTSSGNTGAGNATVSGNNVDVGNVNSTASEGAAGNATVAAAENASTGNVLSSGNAGAGDGTVTSGGNATTGDVGSISNSGNSGNASVIAGGDATTGNVSSIGNTGAGNAGVTAGGDAATGNVSSIGNTGAGNASVIAGGDAATGNVQSISQTGAAGDATVSAVGDVNAGNVSAIGNTGAGDVTVTSSTGSVTAGNLESISTSGFSGDVNVAAVGDVSAGNILSQGQAGSGDISVTSSAGGITTGNVESLSELGDSGNITLNALNDISTGDISSIASQNSGDITVTSQEGAINSGDISSIALNGMAGDITLSALNGINTGEIISSGALGNGKITINNKTGTIQAEEIFTDSEKLKIYNESGSLQIEGIEMFDLGGNQSVLQSLILPNVTALSAIATDSQIQQIEVSRVQEFSDYFGEEMPAKPVTVQNMRNALSDIASITGTQSAIVYINALSDQLELVLFTAEGQPIRKTLPGIKREEVLRAVSELRDRITTPSQRNSNGYLKPARQLYEWLIAPIQEELTANRIDTILFSLDAGLRGLPVAALHDGKQFLVEKYSLALIPSISLMDTTYKSLQGARLLAMGASNFPNLNPLPAVPIELAQITQQRQGKSFLNEEFTRNNLMGQRSNYPYQILHLATHGEFQPGAIDNSYIQLWDEKLGLNQLRQLRLNNPQVELLVLSACKTAVGDEKAELGFAGFAVAAGVKSAVASLWYVSDEGTLALMSQFYNHLNNAKIKGDALRQAQLAMLRGDVQVKEGHLRAPGIQMSLPLPPELANISSNNLSHPYYWSAFTMIGSPW